MTADQPVAADHPATTDHPGTADHPVTTDHPVTATVRLASAGLHVIDRWTDALVDALLDAGAGEPQVGGSLTGGRIEARMTVEAEDVADAGVVAATLLRAALAVAGTPGIRVVGLVTEVGSAPSSAA